MRGVGLVTAAACCLASANAKAQVDKSAPVSIGASYVTDVLANGKGGIRRGAGWLNRGDLTVTVDGEGIGLAGTDFFVDLMAVKGKLFSENVVGDGQGVDNIDAHAALHPIEAWGAVRLGGGTSLKAGLIDLNSEFDVQEVGALFLNSSFGIGPDFSQSGENGPSIFPITSAAAVLDFSRGRFAARIGMFDALPGTRSDPGKLVIRLPGIRGALLVGEGNYRFARGAMLRLGAWHYTNHFDPLLPGKPQTSSGVYATIEGRLATVGRTRGIDAWLRVGSASDTVNPISVYVGGGVTYGGDKQRIGIAVAHARLGDPAMTASRLQGIAPRRAETAIEFTYSLQLTANVRVQPDVQYVIHPGWRADRRNALVTGVRLAFEIGS